MRLSSLPAALAALPALIALCCLGAMACFSADSLPPAEEKEVKGIPIDFEPGIAAHYKYGGSCEFPEGYCVQVYSPDPVDAMTMLVLMARESCRLVRLDQGEPHCQDRPRHGRCLLQALRPGGSPPGTMVQMDIYYGAVPDQKEKDSCNEKGRYYPPR